MIGSCSVGPRPYNRLTDYDNVSGMLVETCLNDGAHRNWFRPRWEYMHFHPYIKNVDLARARVWGEGGEVAGIVHPELFMGEAFLQVRGGHSYLKAEMLACAESLLCERTDGGARLRVLINVNDKEFESAAVRAGYQPNRDRFEAMSILRLDKPLTRETVPQGFGLKSLSDDDDLGKVTRVLHRGFGHAGEPPVNGIDDIRFMHSAPSFRKDLALVALAPNGDFVSFAGTWYEPVNRIAYVEPVATDPDFRRMGLGRAVVMEGIRRCAELGATAAFVNSSRPFYANMGFKEIYRSYSWEKMWRP